MNLKNFKHNGKSRNGIPRYWWDFAWEESPDKKGLRELKEIHIESDREDLPIVLKLCLPKEGSCDDHITFANRIIVELTEGRLTL